MPEISRFLGIVLAIYDQDLEPPHFHTKYGSDRAVFTIRELQLIEGKLPACVTALVLEWAFAHREELAENWDPAVAKKPLYRIVPLVQEVPMHVVLDVNYLSDYELRIRFEDGVVKLVDLAPYLTGGIFQPLQDRAYFETVSVNPDIDTIVWDNGADFSPDFLYEIGKPLTVAETAGAI